MIYSFYFDGGSMDGEVVLRDSAHAVKSIPEPDAWIDFTLGGVVGLGFPVVSSKVVHLSATQGESRAEESIGHEQIYQVVYRDEIAGNVIVRCRYFPWVDLVPPGIKRIVFRFEGGLRDGATDMCTIVRSQEDPSCEATRARYWLTEKGTIGKRFGAGSEGALEMLKSDGPRRDSRHHRGTAHLRGHEPNRTRRGPVAQ
jgi:hypothetical protein